MRLQKRILPILALAAAILACSFPYAASNPLGPAQAEGQPTPFQPLPAEGDIASQPSVAGGAPQSGGGGDVYPQQPEEVVYAFLSAYAGQPADMENYLAADIRSSSSSDQFASNQGLKGELTGFAIQAAAMSNDPPAAEVLVMVALNGQQMQKRFNLAQENGRWVITSITL